MPKASLRKLKSANRLGGHVCVGDAKAASGLQCVSKRTACRQSSTIVTFGNALGLETPQSDLAVAQHRPGVSAVTPALESAYLNAPDAIARPLRAKAKRDRLP
jgi:hypothetical protein